MDNNAHDTYTAANRQQIARNNCYALSFDGTKNRIHYSILGYWKNQGSIPNFLTDWDKALLLAAPGFDVIVDMRTMLTHPPQLNSLHREAMQKVSRGNVRQVANVLPHDKIAGLQVAEIINNANLPSQNFESCEAAEQWLDESKV